MLPSCRRPRSNEHDNARPTKQLSATLGFHGDALAPVPFVGEQVYSLRCGTGLEPVTSDPKSDALPTELTLRPCIAFVITHSRNTQHRPIQRGTVRRWPSASKTLLVVSFEETPVGVEPTSTGLQPVAWPSGSSVIFKQPVQESNLAYDLRRVACDPPHSQAKSTVSRNRTSSRSFEDCDAIQHTHTAYSASRPGIEPGLGL